MRFAVLLEPTATGFSAHVPDLMGCAAAWRTREETLRLIREAVEFHIEGMRFNGEEIPDPVSIPDFVDVFDPKETKTSNNK